MEAMVRFTAPSPDLFNVEKIFCPLDWRMGVAQSQSGNGGVQKISPAREWNFCLPAHSLVMTSRLLDVRYFLQYVIL
jgi:hypothetical protein